MAIEIVTPPGGGQFGPGFRVRLSTDVIGPLPVDNEWFVWIHPVGSETDRRYVDSLREAQHQVQWNWGARSPGSIPLQNISTPVLEGQTVRLLVERREGGAIVETLSQDVVWNMTDGIPLWQEARARDDATGAAFTAEDRIVLQGIQSAWIWELVGELLPEVWQALTSRVRTDPHRRLYDPDRAGEGELTKPQTGFFIKWVGIEWQLIEMPVGVGSDEGNPDTKEIDFMQLTSLRRLNDGSEIFDRTFYENRPNASWYWGFQEPARLTYYILPGALVRFYALIQLEPIAAAGLVTTNEH